MTIRKYLGEVFSDGHFIYFKYDAKRAKDCSSAEGGHRRRSRGGWSAVSAELRKACFLRQQKCSLWSAAKQGRFAKDYLPTLNSLDATGFKNYYKLVGEFATQYKIPCWKDFNYEPLVIEELTDEHEL